MIYHLSGLLFLSLFISVNGKTSNKKLITDVPKVDEQIELTSIVSRLASYEEFSENGIKGNVSNN